MAAPGGSDGDNPAREQLSALRSLLVLAMLLTQQHSQATILDVVANAVESLGRCQLEGIYFDGRWQDVQVPGRGAAAEDPTSTAAITAKLLPGGGQVELADVPWAWAYPLSSPHGPGGYLIVGAAGPLDESERFLLQVLAQQAAVALANAHLHHREREKAGELQVANLALRRRMEIHDRLTRVALAGEGQDGIARAVYELTGRSAAIEDRFGNLRAWAGPDRPGTYPQADPRRRELILTRAMAAVGPIRDEERLVSVAVLGGAPMGVLVVRDPDGTAGDSERMAIEHATTVLTTELARLQNLIETETRLHTNLVLGLVDEGADQTTIMNRAQALGYDLGQPHRVVLVDGSPADEIDMFFHAVSRAARAVEAGSLLAPRLHDVILLARPGAPWDQFRQHVVAELRGGRCRVGVGGRCQVLEEFPRSYREAELALRMQQASGGPEQVTLYDDLGVYKVLGAANDTAPAERFVDEWLARLIDYDSAHGAQLVLTLSEYLECGGNYDASAKALSVHRNTLKYRLNRIRQVSGYDLSLPDNQFNLQLATRAWRTLQALRQS